MNHLTVGVFQDEALGRELGKKGTESDIAMFNRKMDEYIFSFLSPVADKLPPKSQIASSIDAAIVMFNEMSKELGETLVLLDSLGVSRGIAISSPYASPDRIAAITKGTSLQSFTVESRDPVKILEVLKAYRPERDSSSPPVVVVDHSFNVKGVGEVILGFVKRGTVRKYDKLILLPANKEAIVRSIQLQDEEYDQAEAGSRVGLAVKGVTVDELKRGSTLSLDNELKTALTLKLSFEKSPFYAEVRTGAFHTTVGMQTVPIEIIETNEDSVTIKSEKPIVYEPNDTFLVLDLNAKKTRIMGRAHLQN